MITCTVAGKTLTASLDLGTARLLLQAKGINVLRPDLPQGGSVQPLGVAVMLDPLVAGEIAHGMLEAAGEISGMDAGAFMQAVGLAGLEQLGEQIAAELQHFFEGSSRPELRQYLERCGAVRDLTRKLIATELVMDGASSPSSQQSQASTHGAGQSANLPAQPEQSGATNGSEAPH